MGPSDGQPVAPFCIESRCAPSGIAPGGGVPSFERRERMADVFCAHDAMVPIGELRENPRNPNQHPDSQIGLLARVIEENGWRAPITVSTRSGYVVRGHGRLMAAREAGLSECPVDYQDYESDEQELQDMLADNRIAELSEIDEAMLDRMLAELAEAGADVELAGFELPEVEEEDETGEVVADEEADVPFATTLDEENNYVVLKFTRDIDWTNALSVLGLRKEMRLSTRRDGVVTPKMRHIGVGRVIDGAKVLQMIAGGGDGHEGQPDRSELQEA